MGSFTDMLNRIPSRHVREVGETYVEHMKYALGISRRLLKASVAQAVHAVLPDVELPDEHSLTGIAQWSLMEAFKRGEVVPKDS